jgi:hypothetical protein
MLFLSFGCSERSLTGIPLIPRLLASGAFRLALRTATPEGHLRFIDLETLVIAGSQTGCLAHSAVDIDHTAAISTDQVMVVVGDPILKSSR